MTLCVQTTFGAVGFVNQANDSREHKKAINDKFSDDLKSAIDANKDLKVFIFMTNVNLTVGEKEGLIEKTKKAGLLYCDIFDRERIRIALDSPDGFSIRFQYLNIVLSEEEQASFFSRWGDDIQSVISSGFQKVDSTLNRILFLQEAGDPISRFTFAIQLDKKYTADKIGHFRLFCYLTLAAPVHNTLSLLMGSSDKSNRMIIDESTDFTEQKSGIKYGIGTGEWEQKINIEKSKDENEDEKWTQVSSGSSIGAQEVEFITVSYDRRSIIRFFPTINLRDLDEAMFLPFLNQSLAEKVKAIHIYSNGYKLREFQPSDINIDRGDVEPNFPVEFDEEELKDKWVRIRPNISSAFHIEFFKHTPKRLFTPNQVENSLEKRNKSIKK